MRVPHTGQRPRSPAARAIRPEHMRPLKLAAAAIASAMVVSCASPAEAPAPLHLTTTPAGADTRVTVVAAPDLQVNARLAPSLELRDGTILRFTTGRRTADSAYFAEPPSARLPGRHDRIHGTLRASVCRERERVCRAVKVEI
jgi:hypothetical protein